MLLDFRRRMECEDCIHLRLCVSGCMALDLGIILTLSVT